MADDVARHDPFLIAIGHTIARRRLLRGRDSILVAVSGGPDSVALLAALSELGHGRWRIGVGHVNHRLRGRDSQRDQVFVERLAARLGYVVHVAEGPLASSSNLEERARERRYTLLSDIARRSRFRVVATAHTRDDQAETVLHRLLRGSGLGGAGGIQPERADGIVRPLLEVSRRDVLEFLARRGLRYRNDRSNRAERFTRNRIRRSLLPLLEREFNPAVRAALARFADLSRDDDALLDALAAKRARRLTRGGGLDCRGLARLPEALRRRVARQWLAARRGDLRAIGLEHIERICELAVRGEEGKRLALPGGSVRRERGSLEWSRGVPRSRRYRRALAAGDDLRIRGWRLRSRMTRQAATPGPWRAVFDARALDGAKMTVRSPRPGDRIRPLGLGGSKKLQDVFVDAKVPKAARTDWPVVEAAGTVLWVPGLARSESALIAGRSRARLIIEAERVAAEIPMCYGPSWRTF